MNLPPEFFSSTATSNFLFPFPFLGGVSVGASVDGSSVDVFSVGASVDGSSVDVFSVGASVDGSSVDSSFFFLGGVSVGASVLGDFSSSGFFASNLSGILSLIYSSSVSSSSFCSLRTPSTGSKSTALKRTDGPSPVVPVKPVSSNVRVPPSMSNTVTSSPRAYPFTLKESATSINLTDSRSGNSAAGNPCTPTFINVVIASAVFKIEKPHHRHR